MTCRPQQVILFNTSNTDDINSCQLFSTNYQLIFITTGFDSPQPVIFFVFMIIIKYGLYHKILLLVVVPKYKVYLLSKFVIIYNH